MEANDASPRISTYRPVGIAQIPLASEQATALAVAPPVANARESTASGPSAVIWA